MFLKRVLFPQHDRNTWLERAWATAKRLYCILLYIGRIQSLQSFLATGFSDSCLPLEDEALSSELQAMIDWNGDFQHKFLEAQWIFLAPRFGIANSNLNLLSEMPLPFVYEASEAKVARNSIVRQIQMHEAHQDFFKPNGVSEIVARFSRLEILTSHRILAPCWLLNRSSPPKGSFFFKKRAGVANGFEATGLETHHQINGIIYFLPLPWLHIYMGGNEPSRALHTRDKAKRKMRDEDLDIDTDDWPGSWLKCYSPVYPPC